MKKINFSNYEYFVDVNRTYSDFKLFKKTRMHINKELHKKAKYNALKKQESSKKAKKQVFFDEKLLQSLDRLKELWSTLTSFCIPKKGASNFSAIDINKLLTNGINTS